MAAIVSSPSKKRSHSDLVAGSSPPPHDDAGHESKLDLSSSSSPSLYKNQVDCVTEAKREIPANLTKSVHSSPVIPVTIGTIGTIITLDLFSERLTKKMDKLPSLAAGSSHSDNSNVQYVVHGLESTRNSLTSAEINPFMSAPSLGRHLIKYKYRKTHLASIRAEVKAAWYHWKKQQVMMKMGSVSVSSSPIDAGTTAVAMVEETVKEVVKGIEQNPECKGSGDSLDYYIRVIESEDFYDWLVNLTPNEIIAFAGKGYSSELLNPSRILNHMRESGTTKRAKIEIDGREDNEINGIVALGADSGADDLMTWISYYVPRYIKDGCQPHNITRFIQGFLDFYDHKARSSESGSGLGLSITQKVCVVLHIACLLSNRQQRSIRHREAISDMLNDYYMEVHHNSVGAGVRPDHFDQLAIIMLAYLPCSL